MRIDGDDELGRYARASAVHEASACPGGNCSEMLAARRALASNPNTCIVLECVDARTTRAILLHEPNPHSHGSRPIGIISDTPEAQHLLAAAQQLGWTHVVVSWTNRQTLESQLARVPRRFRGQ
jgi:hypothetical protein